MIKGNTGGERSFSAAQAQIFPSAETHSFQEDQNTHTLMVGFLGPHVLTAALPACSAVIPHPTPGHAGKSVKCFRKHLF